jgi:hypothetical protein
MIYPFSFSVFPFWVVFSVEVKDDLGNLCHFGISHNMNGNYNGGDDQNFGFVTLKGKLGIKNMILEFVPQQDDQLLNRKEIHEARLLSGKEWALLLKYLVYKNNNR